MLPAERRVTRLLDGQRVYGVLPDAVDVAESDGSHAGVGPHLNEIIFSDASVLRETLREESFEGLNAALKLDRYFCQG